MRTQDLLPCRSATSPLVPVASDPEAEPREDTDLYKTHG